MTRKEHLEWAKNRAKEYLDKDDWHNAWASFQSDLLKHDETCNHAGIQLGNMLILTNQIRDSPSAWRHIDGFL